MNKLKKINHKIKSLLGEIEGLQNGTLMAHANGVVTKSENILYPLKEVER